MMNTTDYENIWQKSLIHVTDEFALPPVVLQAGEAIIGTLGNFSVSTGKAKAKKTFNVSAIVAAALINGKVLEYQASFPESKRTINITHFIFFSSYFDMPVVIFCLDLCTLKYAL